MPFWSFFEDWFDVISFSGAHPEVVNASGERRKIEHWRCCGLLGAEQSASVAADQIDACNRLVQAADVDVQLVNGGIRIGGDVDFVRQDGIGGYHAAVVDGEGFRGNTGGDGVLQVAGAIEDAHATEGGVVGFGEEKAVLGGVNGCCCPAASGNGGVYEVVVGQVYGGKVAAEGAVEAVFVDAADRGEGEWHFGGTGLREPMA